MLAIPPISCPGYSPERRSDRVSLSINTNHPYVVTPIRQQPTMSGWKSAFEFDDLESQQQTKRIGFDTTKRFRKTKVNRKGGFRKKAKLVEVPNLLSVVNAKPEIKKRATIEVEAREKKREEKRKNIVSSRIVVKKAPLKQLTGTWTNAISQKPAPTTKLKKSKSINTKRVSKQSSPKNYSRSASEKGINISDATKDITPKKNSRKRSPKKLSITNSSSVESSLNGKSEKQKVSRVKSKLPKKDKSKAEPAIVEALDGEIDTTSYDSKRSKVSISEKSPKESESSTHSGQSRAAKKEKKQIFFEFALAPMEGREDVDNVVPVDVQSELSSIGSWPSIASQDSYDTRMNKMMQRWVDVNGGVTVGREVDDRTVYDNNVDLKDNVLDHIVLVAPDLGEAISQFETLTGLRPYPVGPLQGLGAKTAHVGLDGNRYIEILAPDDDCPGPIGEELKKLKHGTLTPSHYAIRSSEVTRLISGYIYDVLGWEPDQIAMVQALPDNSVRQWDLLTMYGHEVGGCAPCYVNWKDPAHHPTASIALKGQLETFKVRAPKFHDVQKLIMGMDGITIEHGKPFLECTVSTPKGLVTFSTDNPRGLVFPGFDEES